MVEFTAELVWADRKSLVCDLVQVFLQHLLFNPQLFLTAVLSISPYSLLYLIPDSVHSVFLSSLISFSFRWYYMSELKHDDQISSTSGA